MKHARNPVVWLVGLLIMFLAVNGTRGEEVSVDLIGGGWSVHHNSGEKDYNQVHEGFGVEANGYVLQQYTNSIRNKSYVVGKYIGDININKHIRYRGLVAAVSGYNSTGAVPAYLPTLSVDYGKLGVDFISVPGVVTYAHVRIRDVVRFENPVSLDPVRSRSNAIGYSYGSLGSRLTYYRRMSDSFTFTVAGSNGFFGRSEDFYGGMYNEWLDTETYSIGAIYFPFTGRWSKHIGVEGGYISNSSDYNADARRWIGVSTLGRRDAFATMAWQRDSWYAGVRLGNPWDRGLGFHVSLGVMSISDTNLRLNNVDIDDVSFPIDLEYYPILQFGLTHTF